MKFWEKINYEPVLTAILDFLPNLGYGLLVLAIAWWISSKAKSFVIALGEFRNVSPALLNFIGRFAHFGIFSIGCIISLSAIGIDVTTLTASLGLTGFAVGFALKDTISNLIAGIMVIFYKTFRKGDHIEVKGVEGEVEEVNLRYTVLQMEDGKIAFIPNSTMFSNNIIVTPSLSKLSDDDGYKI